MNKLIHHFTEKPKTLFLIDSIGAMITALFLFVINRQFDEYFGIPKTVLTYLSIIAVCFCIYSSACYIFLNARWTPFIRLIGVANLLYSALTLGILIKFYSFLSTIAVIYFSSEIVIICILSYIELNVATRIVDSYFNK